jgi:putative FmdB family regulatory protein
MPLYEYECARTKDRFEVIQRFSDDPLTECPDCGAAVKKILSAPAIKFKGAGWYVNDYGKGGELPKSENKADKPAKSTETKSETKKSDAKPAAKSD